jgi:hypothetical protein
MVVTNTINQEISFSPCTWKTWRVIFSVNCDRYSVNVVMMVNKMSRTTSYNRRARIQVVAVNSKPTWRHGYLCDIVFRIIKSSSLIQKASLDQDFPWLLEANGS